MSDLSINEVIDSFYEEKRLEKDHKIFTNEKLKNALKDGKLFIACIEGVPKNIVSKAIIKISGPYSHVAFVADIFKYKGTKEEMARLYAKFDQYYKTYKPIDYAVLASADDNGMNYFDISNYQNRRMKIFQVDNPMEDKIISKFLTEEMMKKHYDYSGLVGQIFRKFAYWLYKIFDDERALYCSEQMDETREFKVYFSDKKDSSPTQVCEYCEKHYKKVYDNITAA